MIQKFLLLFLFGLFFNVEYISACTCADTPSVAQARRDASFVFLGKIVDTKYQKSKANPKGQEPDEELTMQFEVERWWKGERTSEITLFVGIYQSPNLSVSVDSCAFQFEKGKRYIVYAKDIYKDGKVRAMYCSRTAEAKEAMEDLRLLGTGKKPKTKAATFPTKKAEQINGREAETATLLSNRSF